MADSILEGIVEHITTCPLLQDGVFRVDAPGGSGCGVHDRNRSI